MYTLCTVQTLDESLPSYAENKLTPAGPSTDCVNSEVKEQCSKLTKLLSEDLHIGQLDSQGEEQVSSAVEDNWGDDDPHIMLNASKVVNI